MSGSPNFAAVEALLAPLRAAVDGLLAAELTMLDADAVPELLSGLEGERRRLDAVDHRVVAEAGERQVAGRYGRASVADLLVSLLRVTPAEAKARVRQAGDLGPRRNLTGEPLPPILPITAAAATAGQIAAGHARVIAHAVDHVPAALPPGAREVVEATLVQAARHEHPGRLATTARLLLARLDPDGPEPVDRARHRGLTLTVGPDGFGRLAGLLTPESAAVWTTILDTLSAPTGESAPSPGGTGSILDAGGDPGMDRRSAPQRRHDALAEAGQRLLRSGALPPAGGTPVTVLVRTTAADLAAGAAGGRTVALTDRDAAWPLPDLLGCLSDADVVPVVTDPAGAVLSLGRTRRLASRAQRLALAARDGGCSFPQCDRPAPWTEVHHVIPWQDGGPTDLDNLTLVCRFHHREFERCGWAVRMADGVPEWIPPPWLDHERRPQRNRAHHPPDIAFPEVREAVA